VCTGDAVVNGPYNYTADANVGNWPNVRARRTKATSDARASRHGAPGGPEVPGRPDAIHGRAAQGSGRRRQAGKKLNGRHQRRTKMVFANPVPASTSITVAGRRKELGGRLSSGAGEGHLRRDQPEKPHGDLPH